MTAQLSLADAVEYLVENPGELGDAFINPRSHFAGRLFSYCSQASYYVPGCGCLSLIKDNVPCGDRYAINSDGTINAEVTKAIQGDEYLIPWRRVLDLRGDALRTALERYAEWQAALPAELGSVVNS